MTKLTFLGGTKEVGKSGFLLETGSENILLEYGVKIKEQPIEFPNPVKKKLDGVLLSHPHLDHSGAVPLLYREKQSCPLYATEITKQLSKLLWMDSIKIARSEGLKPRFNENDISLTEKNFQAIGYRKPFKIGQAKITAFDSGHIPGSCMFLVETNNKKILYTGDINISDSRLIHGADPQVPEADVLMIESTYADREHPTRKQEEKSLIDTVRRTLANDGVCIIASFAIARSQEMLLLLNDHKIDYPIFIDGMAQTATDIINDFPYLLKEYNNVKKAISNSNVQFVDPKKRNDIIKKPCVIITTGGMLSGGPVTYYIQKLHKRKENSLLMTGFQVPGTEGSVLLKTGRYIHENMDLKVRMHVKKFDFSAHASRSELFEFIDKISPEMVFCVHGEKTEKFAEELKEKGYDVASPRIGEVFEL